MNSHRAVIEYPVPPRLEVIASGPLDFCRSSLNVWLEQHPLTTYDDDDHDSGGIALVLSTVAEGRPIGLGEAIALGGSSETQTRWSGVRDRRSGGRGTPRSGRGPMTRPRLPLLKRPWKDVHEHGPECFICWSINNHFGRPVDHIVTRWPNADESPPRFDFRSNRPIVPLYLSYNLNAEFAELEHRTERERKVYPWKWRRFWRNVLLARVTLPLKLYLTDCDRHRIHWDAVIPKIAAGYRWVRWGTRWVVRKVQHGGGLE